MLEDPFEPVTSLVKRTVYGNSSGLGMVDRIASLSLPVHRDRSHEAPFLLLWTTLSLNQYYLAAWL
jgi:hypothetical protein